MLNNRPIITVMGDSGHSAKERAEIIESRLDEVLKKTIESPNVRIIIVDNTPVIESKGIYIISVTNSDAAPAGTTVAELAASWRDSVETGLRRAWLENRSDYHKVAFYRTLIIITVTVLLNMFGVMMMRRYLKITGFFFSVILWLVAVCAIMWQFPIARPYGKSLMHGIIIPALLLSLISIIVIVLFRPSDIFIERYFAALEKLRRKDEGQDKRLTHRITMLRILMAMVLKGGLILTGFLIFMNSLNINIATVLAGAGVVGVAVGLATQDLMKDFVAGFFIAFEDQFAVGDVIRTNTLTGTVEDFTFRITRLRDTEGRLITIPNSTIRTVENLSSGWSQVDFVVPVAYRTDLAKAMNLMLETARELKQEWSDVILEDPQMLGVDQLAESAVNLRMLLKTSPLQQWRVKRELLLRIKNRFDSEGIEIPFPQLAISMQTSGETEKKKGGEAPEK
jgi:small-conductance mechanosensitive channel